jgi:hypothetical protein
MIASSKIKLPILLFCVASSFAALAQTNDSGLPSPAYSNLPEYQVVRAGTNVAFAVSAKPEQLKYIWSADDRARTVVGTNSSLVISNAQYSHSLRYHLKIGPSGLTDSGSPFTFTPIERDVRLVVLNDWGWSTWAAYIGSTNGKSDSLWATRTANPLRLAWNRNCILYGREGFTAISQLNGIPGNLPGQIPITALTRRHGYTRGHHLGTEGRRTDWNGFKVWFCTADDKVVQATVREAFVRSSGGYDYTVMIFDRDLPKGITPMWVAKRPPPEYYAVMFSTCQHGFVAANFPLFTSSDVSRPAFNDHNVVQGGDSGAPDMLTTPEGKLVFVGGRSTSGPSPQMQSDMDKLSASKGLKPDNYKMKWYSMP